MESYEGGYNLDFRHNQDDDGLVDPNVNNYVIINYQEGIEMKTEEVLRELSHFSGHLVVVHLLFLQLRRRICLLPIYAHATRSSSVIFIKNS